MFFGHGSLPWEEDVCECLCGTEEGEHDPVHHPLHLDTQHIYPAVRQGYKTWDILLHVRDLNFFNRHKHS